MQARSKGRLKLTVMRFISRCLAPSLMGLLLTQAVNAQQAPPMSPSVVLVLKLVSATHVKPATGIVVSDNGLVLVPADFVSAAPILFLRTVKSLCWMVALIFSVMVDRQPSSIHPQPVAWQFCPLKASIGRVSYCQKIHLTQKAQFTWKHSRRLNTSQKAPNPFGCP